MASDINTAYKEYTTVKDDAALENIIEAGEGIVRHFAAVYGDGLDCDDLYQTGMIGLLRAARTYDPAGGAAFSTWASSCVISEIRHYARRERVYLHSQDDGAQNTGCETSDGRNPPKKEPENENYRSFHLAVDDKIAIEQAAKKLGELERRVIEALYYRGLTQKQTAKELGLTQRRVSRLKCAAIEIMRELLNPASFHLLDAGKSFKKISAKKARRRK